MERLSKYNLEKLTEIQKRTMSDIPYDNALLMALEEIKEYRQLKEDGRLIELPCAVGDMVYRVNKGSINHPIMPMGVTEVVIKNTEVNTFNSIKCKGVLYGGELEYKFSEIGETVFLTKEDAEKKLKEMESE